MFQSISNHILTTLHPVSSLPPSLRGLCHRREALRRVPKHPAKETSALFQLISHQLQRACRQTFKIAAVPLHRHASKLYTVYQMQLKQLLGILWVCMSKVIIFPRQIWMVTTQLLRLGFHKAHIQSRHLLTEQTTLPHFTVLWLEVKQIWIFRLRKGFAPLF